MSFALLLMLLLATAHRSLSPLLNAFSMQREIFPLTFTTSALDLRLFIINFHSLARC